MICPYCKNQAEWVENKEIYGRNYGKSFMCYLCKNCNAYVGCHNNTRKALGTMANKELREWCIKAHDHIDNKWKSGAKKRKEVYQSLKLYFGEEVHIGSSNIKRCKEICQIWRSLL